MSEKSPSVEDIWNKHYATQEAFTKAMYKFRNQTLADVEKIIDLVDKENGWEENPVTKHRAILVLTLQERLKEEIKKIQSPESLSEELSLNKDNPAEVSKDTNTQNFHTGGTQSTGGLTGGEVKSEETYNGVNSQKPVICKPEPLCPPANNQNLKGWDDVTHVAKEFKAAKGCGKCLPHRKRHRYTTTEYEYLMGDKRKKEEINRCLECRKPREKCQGRVK